MNAMGCTPVWASSAVMPGMCVVTGNEFVKELAVLEARE
jgi:hypothetical protein